MHDKELVGLARMIMRFREAVKETLRDNEEFHAALNGEVPIRFEGLGPYPNEYLIDPSDALFWNDPEAYTDELDRWQSAYYIDTHTETIEYLTKTDQKAVFLDLVDAIRKKRVAPFVGAGLSQPSGFPLWGEAIKLLVVKLEGVSASEVKADQPGLRYLKKVKALTGKGKYVEAAQVLYENAKTQVDNFIRTKFSLPASPNQEDIHGAIKLLPDISDGCIVTTNFDELIEQVYIARDRPLQGYMHGTQKGNKFIASLIKGDRCILKLHGNVSDHETYIFSKQQYDDAYGATGTDYGKPLPKALRQIFISHSLLFLGCSLEQDRTLTLLEEVVRTGAFEVPEHFAIVAKLSTHAAQQAKEDHLLQLRIRPLWYETPGGSHNYVEALLSLATDCARDYIKL